MKTLIPITFILSILLFTISCGDEGPPNDIEDPQVFTFDLSEITPTDANGALLGNPDETDWTLDEEWPEIIQDLFEDYNSYEHTCPASNDLIIYPAYPNPGSGVFSISMERPTDSTFDLLLVNQFGAILGESLDITGNNISISTEQLVPEQDSFVRVYYRLTTIDNCAFLGHGDIQLKS